MFSAEIVNSQVMSYTLDSIDVLKIEFTINYKNPIISLAIYRANVCARVSNDLLGRRTIIFTIWKANRVKEEERKKERFTVPKCLSALRDNERIHTRRERVEMMFNIC